MRDIYIDAGYLFSVILQDARTIESNIYGVQREHGVETIMNNYVVVYDILIRMFKSFYRLMMKVDRYYDYKHIVMVRTPLREIDYRFTYEYGSDIDLATLRTRGEEIADKLICVSGAMNKRRREHIRRILEFYDMDADFQGGYPNETELELPNRLYEVYGLELSVPTRAEQLYLYDVFLTTFDYICGDISAVGVVMISDHPQKNIEVMNLNGEILSYTTLRRPTVRTIKYVSYEARRMNTVVDSEISLILAESDANLLPIVHHYRTTFVDEERIDKTADGLMLENEAAETDYTLFRVAFRRTAVEMERIYSLWNRWRSKGVRDPEILRYL